MLRAGLCSPTANGSIFPSGVERGKDRCTWVREKAAVYPPEPVRVLSSRDLVGPVLRKVAGSWVTRHSHKSVNFQPKI